MDRAGGVWLRNVAGLVLLAGVLARPALAQRDFIFEEVLPPEQATRHRLEMGFLSSGVSDSDLDKESPVFVWDYVTYLDYRYQLTKNDRIRLRHMYWDYITGNYRNMYDVGWWRKLGKNRALSVTFDYLDEQIDYESGALYVGYQDVIFKDLIYYIQGGVGHDSEEEWHGSAYVELVKPLTHGTLLRIRDDFIATTADYRANTFRINLIQALSKRVAVNIGYRMFANRQPNLADSDLEPQPTGPVTAATPSAPTLRAAATTPVTLPPRVEAIELPEEPKDIRSHQGSIALTYQLFKEVFLTGGYRYYHNNVDLEMHALSFDTRWNISKRYSILGGYQYQDYEGGPVNHGLRFGVAINF